MYQTQSQHDVMLAKLTTALQPARRAWVQIATEAIAPFGLSASVSSAIVFVARRPEGMIQSHLADLIGISPAMMVRAIDEAEASGLLERRSDANDRRVNCLAVSTNGAVVASEIERELVRLRRAQLGTVPIRSVVTAYRVLRAIEQCGPGSSIAGDR